MASTTYIDHPKNPVRTWEELVTIEAGFDTGEQWSFRGQDVLDYPATSLQRLSKGLGISGGDIADLEIKLIRDFARRYHLYAGSAPPPKGNVLEWLSLMRHYGAPTRLLDFSYSFFIATFFALEASAEKSTVWAVNKTDLVRKVGNHISLTIANGKDLVAEYLRVRDGKPFRELFMGAARGRFVYVTNPLRLNERLTVQQGVFLAPSDVEGTFEDNVAAVPGLGECVQRIVIDPSARNEILQKLYRMGISAASLYPGLEGFARSLRTKSLVLRGLPTQHAELLEDV